MCCEPNLRASVGSSMVPIMSCKTSKVSCCDYHFLASPSLHCHSFWIDVQSTECCVPVDYNNYRVENPQCWKNVGNAQDSQWTYTFLCAVIFDVHPLIVVNSVIEHHCNCAYMHVLSNWSRAESFKNELAKISELRNKWIKNSKNGLLLNIFAFSSDFDKTRSSCSNHVYCNFTKFHQNRMKNKKVFIIAHFLNS